MSPAVPCRRVLVISYTYPPMPTVGANRWDAMTRHLRRMGSEVTVLTTAAFGTLPDPDAERHVHRVYDLTSAGWLRKALRRKPLPPPSTASGPGISPGHAVGAAPAESPLPPALRRIFVPDLYIATWVPQAMRAARRIIAAESVDCIVTTSPYESAHLLGLALRKRGPAWVADFRDGWSFEPHRPSFPTSIQRALDRQMERRIARGADRVVGATQPIVEDFKCRLGVDAVHVANGFDPLRYPALPEARLPGLPPDAVLLVHTGTLSGVNGRDPSGMFAAIRSLRDADPRLASRLRLVLAGRLDTDDLWVVSQSGLEAQIVLAGERSHAESLALQRRADALVLVTSADGSEVTGKLFEYLIAGRPIIALAGAAVADIVGDTGTGVTVHAHDVAGITAQLRRLLSGELRAAYRPRNLDRYVYPAPAERMAEVIDAAIGDRRADGVQGRRRKPAP